MVNDFQWWFVKDAEVTSDVLFKMLLQNLPWETEKHNKNLSGWDSNLGPPEYKVGMPLIIWESVPLSVGLFVKYCVTV